MGRTRVKRKWRTNLAEASRIQEDRDTGLTWDDCSFLSFRRGHDLYSGQDRPAVDVEIIGFMNHHNMSPPGKALNKIAPTSWSTWKPYDRLKFVDGNGDIHGTPAGPARPRQPGA